MISFLKRAASKIGRFFWSWGFLKFVLLAFTLCIFLYVEEDWRGARAWVATQAKWQAQGETFDIFQLSPRPVPRDQNLAALPLFKMEPNAADKAALQPLALNQAFRINPSYDLPRGGNWQKGKLADAQKNRKLVTDTYLSVFKALPPTQDSLAEFNALYPALDELRLAAASHPYCQFEQNYRFDEPYHLYLPLITAQIKLSQFLTAHAILALDAPKPDVALEDIETNFKLVSGLREQPLLVSGLCAIGMTSVNFSVIYQGLVTHAWNDAQLAELQNVLAQTDFLADYQHSIRGEACISTSFLDQFKHQTSHAVTGLYPKRQDSAPFFRPDGWIDMSKARSANFDLTAVHFVDVNKRVLSPHAVDQFVADVETKQRSVGASFSLWNILSRVAVGPIKSAVQKFVQMQVWVDEARIACALERYRLAHGTYPGSLAALIPSDIDELPHDIMTGEPYHYQLRADGTFLLYSVGWNGTDDGGSVVFKKDAPIQIDYNQGDWVWPTPDHGNYHH